MTRPVSNAGLPTDHDAFKVMVEIELITKQAGIVFEKYLPPSMTRAQFGVLNRLARLQAEETISDMARAFGVAQPTMSSTVGRLLKKGLVRTEADQTDGRRKMVRLTKLGAEARNQVVRGLEPLFDAFADSDVMMFDWGNLLDQLVLLRDHIETL